MLTDLTHSRASPLPQENSGDGDLQAEYWSGGGYNYAVVSPTDSPAAQQLKQSLQF
jgi:anti-sigma factor RsiW